MNGFQLTGQVAQTVKGPGRAVATRLAVMLTGRNREEVAKAVCFLASGASSDMTGSTIIVDGGLARGV